MSFVSCFLRIGIVLTVDNFRQQFHGQLVHEDWS